MTHQIPRSILVAINQLYEIEEKLKKYGDAANVQRNVSKMKDALGEDWLTDPMGGQARVGFVYEDPMGQPFKETRTDLEATISGSGTENLLVVEVIRPIIRAIFRHGDSTSSKVVQKGVVIVESRKEQ